MRFFLIIGSLLILFCASAMAQTSGDSSAIGKVLEIQGELRDLTGRQERTEYDVRQILKRLDKFIQDVDNRLRQLEELPRTSNNNVAAEIDSNGAVAETAVDAIAPEEIEAEIPAASVSNSNVAAEIDSNGAVAETAVDAIAPEEIEAEIPAASVSNSTDAQSITAASQDTTADSEQVASSPTENTLENSAIEHYNKALAQISSEQYQQARPALKAFLEKYPEHEQAGSVAYWLGETYYRDKEYEAAAQQFSNAYKNYPNNSYRLDSLLKLAMVMKKLGEKSAACDLLKKLLATPDVAPFLKKRATKENQALQCS